MRSKALRILGIGLGTTALLTLLGILGIWTLLLYDSVNRVTVLNQSGSTLERVTIIDPLRTHYELGRLGPGEKRTLRIRLKGEGRVMIRVESAQGEKGQELIGYISPPHTGDEVAAVVHQGPRIQVLARRWNCNPGEWTHFQRIFPHPDPSAPFPGLKVTRYLAENRALTPSEIDSVTQVLQYYKIEFRKTADAVRIPCIVWNDENLISNFTTKSEDLHWLRDHGK